MTVIALNQKKTIRSRVADFGKTLRCKIQSIPAFVPLAIIFLIATYSWYYGIFELDPTVNHAYHTVLSNPDQRHLFARAAPEAIAMTLAVSSILYLFVTASGRLKKQYPIYSIPKMFLRAFLGILVSIPAIAAVYGLFYLWNLHWAQIHSFILGSSLSHIHAPVHIVASNPDTVSKLVALLTTDGQKKVIVIAGVLVANVLVMKPFYYNIQNWFGERHILKHDGYAVRTWYYRFLPAYWDHLLVISLRINPKTDSNWREKLSPKNHGLHNEIFLWISRVALLISFAAGAYIAVVIAH